MKFLQTDSIRGRLNRALLRAAQRVAPSSIQSADVTRDKHNLDDETITLWGRVKSRTMTSILRIDALRTAIEFVHANSIAGDIVECGVWRGGSMMAAGLTLLRLGSTRPLWLYDTFAGMPPPEKVDVDFMGRSAADLLASEVPDTSLIWAKSTLEDVKAGLAGTNYPATQIKYVVGPVESTIPANIPDKISLLRLDTDWFSSTYHELVHLWPRITQGGILILDDYGYWAGAKKAVDQYFGERGIHPLLHRIDETGRLIIKCGMCGN
ncbi:MAG: class I SAM-dependent methyltransferase [Hyphomicrobiales bacterium]|nr:class I SAM-dependent methyltransferase [Acidobacteriaceae bacterium]MBV9974862.1 class I SAM-dependent methyltransferase [Hyphomicrobiales bacterium]